MAPVTPARFRDMLQHARFTNGADEEVVYALQEKVFAAKTAAAERLLLFHLPLSELGPLCDVLPRCAALRELDLNSSPSLLAAEGAAGRLVGALRGCTALTQLALGECSLGDGAVRGLIPLLSGDGGWGEVVVDISGNPAVTDELKGELRRRGLVAEKREEKGFYLGSRAKQPASVHHNDPIAPDCAPPSPPLAQ